MGYAVELYFDKESEEVIKAMWKVLYDKDISKSMYKSDIRPHITLAVYDNEINDLQLFMKKEKFLQSVEVISSMFRPMDVLIREVGITKFESVEYVSLYLVLYLFKPHPCPLNYIKIKRKTKRI